MGKIEINSLDNKVYVDTVEKIDLNVFDQRNSLLFKGNLATAQDLNNYIIPGIYHQESNAFAAADLNYPAPYAGVLEVTAGDGMVYQKYHSYREQEAFYYRAKYTTSWSAWTQVASKLYADTKQPTLVSGTNIKTVNSTSLLGSGNVDILTPDATETVKGKIEIATSAEVLAGIDTVRAVTPAGLKAGLNATGTAPIYACRAWVNFNGTGTVAIRASGNVSSITDNGTGDYTINFTTAMPDANYSASAMSEDAPNQASTASVLYGLSSFRFICTAESNSTRYVVDKAYCSVQIIR